MSQTTYRALYAACGILLCAAPAMAAGEGGENNIFAGDIGNVLWTLIIFGLVLVALGLLWPVIAKLGLGRLPGDIVIERENFRLYLPITTSIVISAVLSLILWLINR